MERPEIDSSLKRIFSDLFDMPESEFSYATFPENVEKWDSLGHVKLIAAIEEEFQLEISPELQLEMLGFELIGDIVHELQ